MTFVQNYFFFPFFGSVEPQEQILLVAACRGPKKNSQGPRSRKLQKSADEAEEGQEASAGLAV